MTQARMLPENATFQELKPVVGVFSAGDPRVDQESRERCRNIVKMVADIIAENVTTAEVVYSPILVDSELQADIVAQSLSDKARRPAKGVHDVVPLGFIAQDADENFRVIEIGADPCICNGHRRETRVLGLHEQDSSYFLTDQRVHLIHAMCSHFFHLFPVRSLDENGRSGASGSPGGFLSTNGLELKKLDRLIHNNNIFFRCDQIDRFGEDFLDMVPIPGHHRHGQIKGLSLFPFADLCNGNIVRIADSLLDALQDLPSVFQRLGAWHPNVYTKQT